MRIIFVVSTCIVVSILLGCARQPRPPVPEIPGLQQYYQMPGNYYTAPPPQLEYWDPDQHLEQREKMNFRDGRRSNMLRNQIQKNGGTRI